MGTYTTDAKTEPFLHSAKGTSRFKGKPAAHEELPSLLSRLLSSLRRRCLRLWPIFPHGSMLWTDLIPTGNSVSSFHGVPPNLAAPCSTQPQPAAMLQMLLMAPQFQSNPSIVCQLHAGQAYVLEYKYQLLLTALYPTLTRFKPAAPTCVGGSNPLDNRTDHSST